MPTDSKGVIINQTMAKELGLSDPIGKRITNGGSNVMTVIGVVEDFHFESLKENIRGVCLSLGNSPNIVSVKIGTADMSGAIKSITSIWNKFSVNQPIRYSFLDESFALMYADVQRIGRIFSAFAILAIIVACLGLFALSSFMIEQRTKEIGIRKVNGAKSIEVTTTLNKDFLTWVAIAFVIATPIAYYTMGKWLENFAYKTELSWWIFALAGALALGIALLTVSWQSWRAATRNPVEALRYE
jgi:putative ABC transport system permease protein